MCKMSVYQYIGKNVARVDGAEKASGRTRYMTDLRFPGMLFGKAVHAPYAHALIKDIAIDDAKAVPGVIDIFTAKDVPGINLQGNLGDKNMPVFAFEKTRYLGDVLAFVVAETEEAARAGALAVKTDYDPLPVYTDPLEAMKPDAVPIHGSSNILDYAEAETGNIDKAFAEADYTFENTYTTHREHQAYIETLGGFAVPEKDGGVSIYMPSQNPYGDLRQISAILNLPQEKIHIIGSPGGGGFGGKDNLYCQGPMAIAALRTGRPIYWHADREETMLMGVCNQPYIYKIRTAVRKDGTITGQDVEIICDNGAYLGLGLIITHGSLENCCGSYHIPNLRAKGYTVNTNQQYTGEWRGFGNNQAHFAIECQMDDISRKLGMDPIELRLKNVIHSGDLHPLGHEISRSVSGAACTMEAAGKCDIWKKRSEFKAMPSKPWMKRGIGIASCIQPFTENYSHTSALSVTPEGKFIVHTSITEHGAGSTTAFCMMAAESLGVPIDQVSIDCGSSDCSGESGPITGARSNYAIGNTTLLCVMKMKIRLTDCAGKLYGIPSDELKYEAGNIVTADGKKLNFSRICTALNQEGGACVESTLKIQHPAADGLLPDRHRYWSFLTQLVGVEVNTLTGKTDVLFANAIIDAGQIINRLGFEGQVEGGNMMGIGMALTENMETSSENAKLITENLQTYLIPTVQDMPRISMINTPSLEETGPYGAKGIGEIPAVPIVAALGNAIYDAVGVRMTDIPFTPEKLYHAMKETGVVKNF